MENVSAYLLIAAVALAIIVCLITRVMEDFSFYTKDSGFIGKESFFIGILIVFLLLTYIIIKLREISPNKNVLLFFYLFFLITFILWVANLALRTEFYVKGARVPMTTGSFFIFLALLSLLGILYYGSLVSQIGLLTIIPVIWIVYLIHNWTFKTMPLK